MLGVFVGTKGVSEDEATTIRRERRQKVSPGLVEAQMGLKDLVLFQVKPLQGSTLKEW